MWVKYFKSESSHFSIQMFPSWLFFSPVKIKITIPFQLL
jgi:hypothetical protein